MIIRANAITGEAIINIGEKINIAVVYFTLLKFMIFMFLVFISLGRFDSLKL